MPTLRLDRALIRATGADARSFLDGVLTQHVDKLAAGAPLYAALLSPQGKVLADMTIWPDADGAVLIETDPARADDLYRRLSMYKLRAQAKLERLEGVEVQFSPERFDGALADPRFPDGALGWRKLAPRSAGLSDGASTFDALRITLGVPDLARDAESEEVFGLEALLDELNGVDFKKGCFVGQENVSRMKRRATTRKKFCPVIFDGDAPAYGATITAGAAELGSIRTGMAGRALALLRLDRASEAIDKGEALLAEGRPLRLDPPPWLILPPKGAPD